MAAEEEVIKVEKKPKKRKKTLIIIAVAVLAVLLLLVLLGWLGLRTGVLGFLFPALEERWPAPAPPEQVEKVPDYMFEVPEILVNLDDGGSRNRFLSVKFYVGYDNSRLESQLEQRMPEIRDNVNKVLWNVSSEDILTADGKEQLRDDLHRTINEMFLEDEIVGIYFWHVMVQ